MDTTPTPPAPPAPPAYARASLRARAQELQARLGYVQLQLDALGREKRAIVAALQTGEQVYAALEPMPVGPDADGGAGA